MNSVRVKKLLIVVVVVLGIPENFPIGEGPLKNKDTLAYVLTKGHLSLGQRMNMGNGFFRDCWSAETGEFDYDQLPHGCFHKVPKDDDDTQAPCTLVCQQLRAVYFLHRQLRQRS